MIVCRINSLQDRKYFVLFCCLLINSKSPFLCLPPSGSGDILFFPWRPSVCLSVRLSVTNRVRSITRKPLKLYSRNFIQISISMRWRAECKNSNFAFYTFWVISLGTLFITKIVSALLLENRLSCIHITLYKYQSAWYDVQSARMVTLLFILF